MVATSASSIWATGGYTGSQPGSKTLILHWNGSRWRRQATPQPGTFNSLLGIAATSAANAWAVGYVSNGSVSRTFIVHWNGSSWSRMAGTRAGELHAVKAFSPSNVWAVGDYTNSSGQVRELTMHWNGSSWSTRPGPDPSATYSYLEAIAGVSASDFWVVGRKGNANFAARYC
jgi:hypothetical protein